MLFFWTLESSEYNTSTFEVNAKKTLTEKEQTLNHTVGIVLVFCFLVSTVMNPILFHHHRSTGKNGCTNFLFSSLAASDFLTNLVSPPVLTYYIVRPQVVGMLNPILAVAGVVACTAGCFSQCVTALLAVTRFLKIVNPFIQISKRLLIFYLAVFTIYMLINNSACILAYKFEIPPNVFKLFVKGCSFVNKFNCFLGILFSIATVIYVFFIKSPSQTDLVTKRVCGTILLMNMAYIVTLMAAVVPILSFYDLLPNMGSIQLNLIYFTFFVMPVLTSAWNPIVLFVKAQAVRENFIQVCRSIEQKFIPRDCEHRQQVELKKASTDV